MEFLVHFSGINGSDSNREEETSKRSPIVGVNINLSALVFSADEREPAVDNEPQEESDTSDEEHIQSEDDTLREMGSSLSNGAVGEGLFFLFVDSHHVAENTCQDNAGSKDFRNVGHVDLSISGLIRAWLSWLGSRDDDHVWL